MVREVRPHYTIHIGDVYYVGAADEVKANCLGQAPARAKQGVEFRRGAIGTFAFAGNHELYSRGYGYFDEWLPKIGINDPKTNVPKVRDLPFLHCSLVALLSPPSLLTVLLSLLLLTLLFLAFLSPFRSAAGPEGLVRAAGERALARNWSRHWVQHLLPADQ